jgi:glutathione S-transferase
LSKDSNKKLAFAAGAALALGGLWYLKKSLPLSPKVPVTDDNTVLLFEFPYSPFCIKVAKIMDYKGIPYKTVDLLPFVHKNFVKSISGQSLVPVIKHKGRIIYDSTVISKYLDEIQTEPSIYIKEDSKLNHEVLLMEDWADEALLPPFSKLAIIYLFEHPEVISETDQYNTGIEWIDKNKEKVAPLVMNLKVKDYGIDLSEKDILKKRARASLDILLNKLEENEFLIGNKLTLADITVASHLTVAEKVPYIAEDDTYAPIFEWQKKIFNLLKRRVATSVS